MQKQVIHELTIFIAVAETSSFSRAADRLQVSPSSLSQAIRAFERRLGVSLFNRTTRSVVLTDAGRKLLDSAGPALAKLDEAVDTLSALRSKPAGRIKIMAQRLPASLYLAPILRAFLNEYPDIELDIALDDDTADPVAAGYDIAIRLGETVAQGSRDDRVGQRPSAGRRRISRLL